MSVGGDATKTCMHKQQGSELKQHSGAASALWSCLTGIGKVVKACVSTAGAAPRHLIRQLTGAVSKQHAVSEHLKSHRIQCKTWQPCCRARTLSKRTVPLIALVIGGRRYAGSHTTSLRRHLWRTHDGAYIRLLDDARLGLRRHLRAGQHHRSKAKTFDLVRVCSCTHPVYGPERA